MDAVRTLVAGIKHVDQLIDEDVLEPDPARDDWPRMKARVALVEQAVDHEVLAVLDDALADTESEKVRATIRQRVAALVGAAAALRLAMADRDGGLAWAGMAAKVALDADQRSELEAASEDTESFVLLWHGRWLQEHGRRAEADRVMKGVAQKAKSPALRKAAKKGLRAPRPLTSAPPLFRLNGCGVALYGERDRQPDGSYIATYCICILFIPVLPLTAYRVRHAGDRTYQFTARESLSPLTRGIQIAMLSVAVLAAGWSGVSSWLESPGRHARIAFEEAKATETAGDREGAIAKYSATLQRFESERDVDLDPAAEALIRLTAAGVAEPCTAASVEQIGRVVNTFYELPEGARPGKAAPLLAARLAAWAGQIGDATEAGAAAALTVLDLGARVAVGTAELAGIEASRIRIRRALADRIATERPLRALALYTQGKGDPESIARAKQILLTFGEGPSLWLEAEHEVQAWMATASTDAAVAGFRERLAAAHRVHEADAPIIEAGDEKALAKALAAMPVDQEIAVALASAQRRRGDAKAALATLTALGPRGRMTGEAQQLLAWCHADLGDLARADAVLTAFLADRLAPFQQAQREYAAGMEQLQKRLVADAKAGVLEPDLKSKLEGASEDDQVLIFRTWMSERIDKDVPLGALRSELLRHGAVVGASLALGTIELRRAADATGEERKALLGSAEKAFLSIRQEAEGDPSFHLGLGQVLHRLGRSKDGNVELDHVLEKKDPRLTLAVVHVYRDLALPVRAKQIAEELYASPSATTETKQAAAGILAHLVNEVGFNEDDEEMWLKRADVKAQQTKAMLLRLEARRLLRDGKNTEADQAYARLAAIYERDAKHSATGANNAALAYLDRYGASGDPAQIRTALQLLESAFRLDPQSALVVGNLADVLEFQGFVTVLERWVRTRTLLLSSSSARSLVETLLGGSLHDEVLAALKQDPSLHRSQELAREEQTLSPQKREAYLRQVRWLDWTEDDAGMIALAKRIEAMPPFDAEGMGIERREWETKAKDARTKALYLQQVSRDGDAVLRAQRGGHAPTLGAASARLGDDRAVLLAFDPTPANVDAMVDAQRKATEAWPEGGQVLSSAGILVIAGLHRAAADTPALRKAWEADSRAYETPMLLRRALLGPDGAAVAAALRARPEITEAVRLRKQRPERQLGLLDLALAQIVGDADFEKTARAGFTRERTGAQLAIEARLLPGLAREKADLDAYREETKRR